MKANPIDNNQDSFVIFLAIQQTSYKRNSEREEEKEKEKEEDTKEKIFSKQASEKH